MLTNSKVTYHPMPLVSASRNWRIIRCIKPLHYTHYSASLPTLRWRIIRWSQLLHHALCSGWLQTLRWRIIRWGQFCTILFTMDGCFWKKKANISFLHICLQAAASKLCSSEKSQNITKEWKAVEIIIQFSSVQFKMVSMRLEKPICAPPHISDVSLKLPLKRFHWKVSQKW